MAIQATSEEQLKLKKRARQRLIGAGALLLTAAIVLPLVLDDAPRQKNADIAIDMVNSGVPGKASIPLASPAPQITPASTNSRVAIEDVSSTPQVATAVSSPVIAAHQDAVAEQKSATPTVESRIIEPAKPRVEAQSRTEVKPVTKPEPKVEAKSKPEVKKPQPKVEAQPEIKKPEPKVEPKAEVKHESNISEVSHDKTAQNTQHFVVQLGAFSNAENVQQLRDRLSAVGVATYTEKLPSGATRVRVGPYADKVQADKVLAKINAAGVQAQVVPLK
jgi:DedD protein